MPMMSILLVILAIIAGSIWVYDAATIAPKRLKTAQDEPSYVAYARGTFLILGIIIIIKVLNVGILTLLVILTVVSFLIWIVDRIYFEKARKAKKLKEPIFVDYARSLWWVFLVVLVIRSFVIQPYRVPTGSLEPTIKPHDLVAVNQFAYGLRLPITHQKILNIGEPKTGDIAVFRNPSHPKTKEKTLIKRIIGVPGDHVIYKNKVLYINGKEMKQTFVKNSFDYEPTGNIPSKMYEENLSGIKHKILIHDKGYLGQSQNFDFIVPKGYYFAMGDNRDNSGDSRVWGFVPENDLIGKAFIVLIGWNDGISWNRIGNKL
jgi:signal peptidase I